LVAAAVGLVVVLASASAVADPTPQQKELARDLMQKGRTARQSHDDKLAFDSFKAADDIMHVPTTGFEVARSLTDLGRLVDAHEALVRVMAIPERPDDSQGFRDARGYAKVLDDQLLGRIPQLRIGIDGVSADKITGVSVDGVALPPGALLVPYKVDPGHHVVVATSGGGEARAEVDVKEGESKQVVAHLTAAPAPVVPAPVPAAPEPAAPPAESGRGLGAVTWAGIGIAGAGVIAGSVTGIVSISDKGSLSSQCNGTRCPASANGTLQSANTMATISTVSFAVAGAGAALGLVGFFVLRPEASATTTTGGRVTPWVAIGSAGLNGTF
jgi:hypothetical protein